MRLLPLSSLLLALLTACAAPQAEPDTDTDASDSGPTTEQGTTAEDECLGPEGCYACEPSEPAHLLNACSDAPCQPFANTVERLPLLGPDGELPPLP